MNIPKNVRDHFRSRPAPEVKSNVMSTKPKCWDKLGKLALNHRHDSEGNCLLKNWSRDEVHTSPLGGVWHKGAKGDGTR